MNHFSGMLLCVFCGFWSVSIIWLLENVTLAHLAQSCFVLVLICRCLPSTIAISVGIRSPLEILWVLLFVPLKRHLYIELQNFQDMICGVCGGEFLEQMTAPPPRPPPRVLHHHHPAGRVHFHHHHHHHPPTQHAHVHLQQGSSQNSPEVCVFQGAVLGNFP